MKKILDNEFVPFFSTPESETATILELVRMQKKINKYYILMFISFLVFVLSSLSIYLRTEEYDNTKFTHQIDSLNQKTQLLYEELYFEKQETAIIKLQRDSLCAILDVKSVYLPSLYDLKGAKRLP